MSKFFKSMLLITVFVMLLTACQPAPAPAAPAAAEPAAAAPAAGTVKVGLITKTDTNPFFVKMKEGAEAEAKAKGAELMTAAGKFDGDNAAQVTAIENMVSAGVKGIMITPSDTKAIVPAIKKARDAGVMVIALDTPTDPQEATDALFATDNFKAGVLIGQYAKAATAGKTLKIATLDLKPGITVGVLRHNGFMSGMGLTKVDNTAPDTVNTAEVVCSQDTEGNQAKGQTAMENCLTKDPDINLVYTINEPAAFGAFQALKAAGKEKDVVIVSVDGGCAGVQGIVDGQIAATSQQYPLVMAKMGVDATVDYVTTGKKASGYTDTGVTLVTNKAVDGVESVDAKVGLDKCWGEKPAAAAAAPAAAAGPVKVGLITKTDTNPFFVKMKEGADAEAKAKGAELMSAAGKFDGDNAAQVTAIENMVSAGVKGIMITPSDTKAIVPAIKKARDAGVMVIALDTPTDPQEATDALFATDNFKAGVLIGQYAKAATAGKTLKIATLDLKPGITVGVLRHNGFMSGMGLTKVDNTAPDTVNTAEVVCSQDTEGNQAKGQTAMENCLTKDPDINLVYTINEPAAFGAYQALKAAGKEKDVIIVSVDGGCAGVQGIVDGQIAATSQQYPLLMAQMGVDATVDFVTNGKKASGYTDTGVTLITDKPMSGVDSVDTKVGLDKCWGTK
jgi:fructose transport system substrate-binding protein